MALDVVAPVGLPDVRTAGDDSGANGLLIQQGKQRAVENRPVLAGLLGIFAVAACARRRVDLLAFARIAGVRSLVRRRSIATEGIGLAPACTNLFDQRVDLVVGQL